jgi:hypothetical protein
MASSAAYPPPPPFYRLYKDFEQDPSSAPEPPPPIDGAYQLFGATYTVCCLSHSSLHCVIACVKADSGVCLSRQMWCSRVWRTKVFGNSIQKALISVCVVPVNLHLILYWCVYTSNGLLWHINDMAAMVNPLSVLMYWSDCSYKANVSTE